MRPDIISFFCLIARCCEKKTQTCEHKSFFAFFIFHKSQNFASQIFRKVIKRFFSISTISFAAFFSVLWESWRNETNNVWIIVERHENESLRRSRKLESQNRTWAAFDPSSKILTFYFGRSIINSYRLEKRGQNYKALLTFILRPFK